MKRPIPILALLSALSASHADAPVTGTLSPDLNVNRARDVREVRLAVAPDSTVLLAWIEDTRAPGEAQGQGVFLRRWDGRGWSQPSATLNYNPRRNATSLDLALDERGHPVLVWNENFAHVDLNVFRGWTGTDWTDWDVRRIGQDLTLAAKARATAATRGEPVLAFGDILRTGKGTVLRVKTWRGGTWVNSPDFSNDPDRYAFAPSIGLTRAGRPVVAWLEGNVAASDVLVKAWDGERWRALGGPLNARPGTFTFSPALRLDRQDRPTVAWIEESGGVDRVFVNRWTGRTWQRLGGPPGVGDRAAETPSLALDTDGNAVVAWAELDGDRADVRAARWDGRGWRSLGVIDARRENDARTPSVGVDASGTVHVAWREKQGGVYRVHVRRLPD